MPADAYPLVDVAPPRERGSARFSSPLRSRGGGSPARAGIGLRGTHRSLSTMWLPRASGDRPCRDLAVDLDVEAPPRERGLAPDSLREGPELHGSPARAGIGPSQRSPRSRSRGLPRASGDRPCPSSQLPVLSLAPPRERGLAHDADRGRGRADGSPARAGIGPSRAARRAVRPRLPRVSGDWPVCGPRELPRRGAPPRERGLALDPLCGHARDRGSPARAGIGPPTGSAGPCPRRLPRASGDRPFFRHDQDRGGLGSPARAGIGPRPARTSSAASRLPRASGDWPCASVLPFAFAPAPPRERGSALAQPAPALLLAGSPARAGIGPPSR